MQARGWLYNEANHAAVTSTKARYIGKLRLDYWQVRHGLSCLGESVTSFAYATDAM